MAQEDVELGPDTAPIAFELTDGAAWITLSNPEAGNPLGAEPIGQLLQAIRRAREADVGVVVLRSRGRMFSVGGNLSEFRAAADAGVLVDDLAEVLHRAVSELIHLDAIVVAAVQGTAAGAGFPLAAAADIVLAGQSARFTLAYTKVGLTPDGGSSLLTASLGLHRSLYLALVNPVVSAEEARSMGLVAEVHPDEDLEGAVSDMVGRLTRGSRSAMVSAKHLFRNQAVSSPESAMRRETFSMRVAASSADGTEGIAAFFDKRDPSFPSSRGGS
jgi:2-(1,2-epoxy-1,2-dihydrophenyl)acetyl-CoA isomerase